MNQLSLFDSPTFQRAIEPPAQRHSETSIAAAESIKPAMTQLHATILDYLTKRPDGATDEEMQHGLNMLPNTQRPRRIELCKKGLVRMSGKTRKTLSGRAATVWEVAK